MGACVSQSAFSAVLEAQERSPTTCFDDPVSAVHRELRKDLKRVVPSSIITRAKISMKILGKAELQRAYDFVELQVLLPRRHWVDTQVLLLTAPQLACCGMLLQHPASHKQNLCLHIIFEANPLDLGARGVALANLARLLADNLFLEKLTLNLILMGFTPEREDGAIRKIFSSVMRSFAAMLCVNNTLRLLRFEGMMGWNEKVPWSESDAELVCKAQATSRSRHRLALLMGLHPRSKASSPLVRSMPRDLLRKILDAAIPLRPLCKVEFDFFRERSPVADFSMIPPLIF